MKTVKKDAKILLPEATLNEFYGLDKVVVNLVVNDLKAQYFDLVELFDYIEKTDGRVVKCLTVAGAFRVFAELTPLMDADSKDRVIKDLLLMSTKKKVIQYGVKQADMQNVTLNNFLNDYIEKRNESRKKVTDVYAHYVKYCNMINEEPCSIQRFGKLTSYNFNKTRQSDGKYIENIRLKSLK